MKKNRIYTLLFLGLLFATVSCDYDRFPEPEPYKPATLQATHTIAQLKAMYRPGGTHITGQVVIEGTVISSDREGNIYKALYIQDATGGIEIKVGRSGMYNFYPQGQHVYVNCNPTPEAPDTALSLGAYGRSIDLGFPSRKENYETDFIDTRLIEKYISRGVLEEMPAPKTVTISQVASQSATLDNTWIRLENVQFKASELPLTFADAVHHTTMNRNLEDAGGRTLVVRTSGYARFAGITIQDLAPGAGSVCGIISYYNGTPQLYIISTSDMQLTGARIR